MAYFHAGALPLRGVALETAFRHRLFPSSRGSRGPSSRTCAARGDSIDRRRHWANPERCLRSHSYHASIGFLGVVVTRFREYTAQGEGQRVDADGDDAASRVAPGAPAFAHLPLCQKLLKWLPVVHLPTLWEMFRGAFGKAGLLEYQKGSGCLFRQSEPRN